MKICVCGLWHLGLVTAACVATKFDTTAFDFEEDAVEAVRGGRLPIFEPGLAQLVADGVARGRLRFSADLEDALRDADVVWIAWDTPVDDEDRADSAFVAERIRRLFPHLKPGALLLISSQVPVGFSRRILAESAAATGRRDVSVAYSPENLRLGTAIDAFLGAPRVVLGQSDPREPRARELFSAFPADVLEMSLESAEMAKHALNALLATELSFVNEIGTLCEAAGADVADVARALKSDPRIGPNAYLSPGPGFAGGTLARDVGTLADVARAAGVSLPLLGSIRASNKQNQAWPLRTLREMQEPAGATIALLGLTYKPGTDTLRRSSAVELALTLHRAGARVRAYDPAIEYLPPDLLGKMDLCGSVDDALKNADAAVVATEWPQFGRIPATRFASLMRSPLVIDARRILDESVRADPRIRYFAIGLGKSKS